MRKALYLLAMLALPRIYMLDWSCTPSGKLDYYITSSNDLIIQTFESEVVYMEDLMEYEYGEEKE